MNKNKDFLKATTLNLRNEVQANQENEIDMDEMRVKAWEIIEVSEVLTQDLRNRISKRLEKDRRWKLKEY